MAECGVAWVCKPCTREAHRLLSPTRWSAAHICVLPAGHWPRTPHRNRRMRELDVCQWDGRTALKFPDPNPRHLDEDLGAAHG